MKRAFITALAFAILSGSSAQAAPTLSLAFHATSVTASGATPNSPVVIFSMARVLHRYWSQSVRRDAILSADSSGSVSYDAGGPIPLISVWVAVDLKSGRLAVAAPSGYSVRLTQFNANPVQHGNNDSDDDNVRYGRGYGEFLWVRPGVGAWMMSAGDGGDADHDKRQDGVVSVVPQSFIPIGNSPQPAKKFAGHDIMIVIDPFAMEIFSMEVAS